MGGVRRGPNNADRRRVDQKIRIGRGQKIRDNRFKARWLLALKVAQKFNEGRALAIQAAHCGRGQNPAKKFWMLRSRGRGKGESILAAGVKAGWIGKRSQK